VLGVKSRVSSTVTKRKPNPAPIWKRKRPESLGEPVPLTSKQKAAAKAMAKAAGRKYPNLVDNIAASRMENPTMKTTTKRKPTPAQLAARERFAEMARSGAFKKAGARKRTTTRKANPIGDLPKLKKRYQTVLLTMADLRDDQKRRKQGLPDEMPGYTDAEIANLIARYQAKAQDLREAIAMYEGTKTNPAKPAATRRGNPVKYRDIAKDVAPGRVQYAVHMPDRPSYHAIAYFTKKADAVETAQELSDRTGQPVAVTRVQVHFGPM
jgi:hypothetical protein